MPRTARYDEEAVYQIRVEGLLDEGWSEWMEGLAIEPQAQGETLLTGPIRDQAALHGLLNKIRDLGLPLLRVEKKCGQCSAGKSARNGSRRGISGFDRARGL